MSMSLSDLYGGRPVSEPSNVQGAGTGGTVATPTSATGGKETNPTFPWVAWVLALVAVRVIYEVKGRVD